MGILEIKRERAKVALAELVAVLNDGGEASMELWDILSALRGPDTENLHIKDLSTAKIRGAIGVIPEKGSYYRNGAYISKDLFDAELSENDGFVLDVGGRLQELHQRIYPNDEKQFDHFCCHAMRAIDALRKWGLAKFKEATSL